MTAEVFPNQMNKGTDLLFIFIKCYEQLFLVKRLICLTLSPSISVNSLVVVSFLQKLFCFLISRQLKPYFSFTKKSVDINCRRNIQSYFSIGKLLLAWLRALQMRLFFPSSRQRNTEPVPLFLLTNPVYSHKLITGLQL